MMSAQGISLPTSLSQPFNSQSSAKVDSAATEKLKSTAKEFEATFISMLLKEMRQTLDENEGLFPGDSGDVQGGLFDMFMSRHLANAGGIGVAAYLQRQMQTATSAKPVTSPDAVAPSTAIGHRELPAIARR